MACISAGDAPAASSADSAPMRRLCRDKRLTFAQGNAADSNSRNTRSASRCRRGNPSTFVRNNAVRYGPLAMKHGWQRRAALAVSPPTGSQIGLFQKCSPMGHSCIVEPAIGASRCNNHRPPRPATTRAKDARRRARRRSMNRCCPTRHAPTRSNVLAVEAAVGASRYIKPRPLVQRRRGRRCPPSSPQKEHVNKIKFRTRVRRDVSEQRFPSSLLIKSMQPAASSANEGEDTCLQARRPSKPMHP